MGTRVGDRQDAAETLLESVLRRAAAGNLDERARRIAFWVAAGSLIALLVLQIIALESFHRDAAYLKMLADRSVSATAPATEQAVAMLQNFRGEPNVDNESYFLLPIFRPLRPTPREALQSGTCSDRSRAMIALLQQHRIHATKITLYSREGLPIHAVVDVDTGHGDMVIDPLYRMWFPRPGGGAYGLADLRSNPGILASRVKTMFGARRVYPVERWGYFDARTYNWDKIRLTHAVYVVALRIFGSRVNQLARPTFIEHPQLIVAYGAFLPDIALVLLLCFCRPAWKAPVIPTRIRTLPRFAGSAW